jgi:hypothetical protein
MKRPLFPVRFRYTDDRSQFTHIFAIWCAPGDKYAAAIRKLEAALQLSGSAILVINHAERPVSPMDDVEGGPASAMRIKIITYAVFYRCSRAFDSTQFKRIYTGQMTCWAAKQDLVRHLRQSGPHVLRLTFNGRVLGAAEDLVLLESSQEKPVDVVVLTEFQFAVDTVYPMIPFADTDTVGFVMESISSWKQRQVRGLIGHVHSRRPSGAETPLSPARSMGTVDRTKVITVQFAGPVPLTFTEPIVRPVINAVEQVQAMLLGQIPSLQPYPGESPRCVKCNMILPDDRVIPVEFDWTATVADALERAVAEVDGDVHFCCILDDDAKTIGRDVALKYLPPPRNLRVVADVRSVGQAESLGGSVVDFKKLTKVRRIGRGSFGTVFLMEDEDTRECCAVKFIDPPDDNGEWTPNRILRLVIQECEVLCQLDHPCVLRLKGYCLGTSHRSKAKIATEYMEGGSLAKVMTTKPPPDWWDWTAKSIVVAGIVLGMRYVHSRSVIHRDLKPTNILLDARGTIRIGDFGSARLTTLCATPNLSTPGTLRYLAPEYRNAGYTNKVDVYSFGMVLFEIATGQKGFPAEWKDFDIYDALRDGTRSTIPDWVDPWVASLITRCWA